MSASTSRASWPAARAARPAAGWRFGVAAASGGVEWTLKRNCSITPAQLLAAYGGLCVLSLGVAGFFWLQGARLVMPFAWCELLAVAVAMLVFARHAGDRERITLGNGRLRVETTDGGRVERIEFAQDAVRVESGHDERALVELTGRGERIAVGRHVRPELRPWLAAELRDALREQPRGAMV
jgi:uncharacterized membrane protein